MTGIRIFLIACLVSMCGIAWGADAPAIPAGARIGVIDMVTSDIVHFHIGRVEVNSFMHTYRGDWTAAELIDDPLVSALTGAGFMPVMIAPTETLRDERQSWIVDEPRSGRLPRGCMKELARIMTEQNFAALVIAAPGANSQPAFVDGDRYSRLPHTLQGVGFSTSDEPIGSMKAGIFDFTQIVVVVKDGKGAELVARDWGGNRVYDWPDFDASGDLKSMSDAQIAQLRPVIADAIRNRITTRLMPRLTQ
jgi:hypothetical protein